MAEYPLTLVNLSPDRDAFARWSAQHAPTHRKSQSAGVQDTGYAWHGLLRRAFGPSALKPFVDRMPLRSNLLLGYVERAPDALHVQSDLEPLAVRALGLESLRAIEMPGLWREEQELSFEVRVRPVVRTRKHAKSGRSDEMDAAVHAKLHAPDISREQAYNDWLKRELDRNGAAELRHIKTLAFRRTQVMRLHQGAPRKPVSVEGPDLWVNGRLLVKSPQAFTALLRRGLGRHRAFGFGCLLVGRPGVLDR